MLKFKIKNNANYNLTDISYVTFNKDIIVDGEHYMQFVNNYKYNVEYSIVENPNRPESGGTIK